MLLAACTTTDEPDDVGSDDGVDDGSDDADGADELAVAIASFDLSVGDDQRLMAGLFTADRQLLAFGDVEFQLGHLGEDAAGEVEITQTATASFLAVAGIEPDADATQPTLQDDSSGQGVYAAQVDLDEPGNYGLLVTAELDDGRVLEGQVTFAVAADGQVPDVGDEAPRTVNLTVEDVEAGTAQPISVDSRAQDPDDEIPDRHLHDTTVAESIEEGRPVVVAVSTPVYCASRFCGPLTEVISDLGQRYADRADFVMIEVWENFDEQQLNEAASEWIQTEAGGNEPWVFFVDENGVVADRWDNVLDADALETQLDALPAIPRSDGLEGEDGDGTPDQDDTSQDDS